MKISFYWELDYMYWIKNPFKMVWGRLNISEAIYNDAVATNSLLPYLDYSIRHIIFDIWNLKCHCYEYDKGIHYSTLYSLICAGKKDLIKDIESRSYNIILGANKSR